MTYLRMTRQRRQEIMRKNPAPGRRSVNRRRPMVDEQLESRTLLSYTFVYTDTHNVVVNETVGSDSFTVHAVGGFLQFSLNAGPFSPDWGAPGQAGLATA